MFIGVILLAVLYICEVFFKINASNILRCIVYLLLASGFTFSLIAEAGKFRKKGDYKAVYRITFVAGFFCYAFLERAIEYFVKH